MQFAAQRLNAIKPSASATISQRARAMRAAGQDVIDLGLGEPDFDTPAHIVEAAHQAAAAGQTRYPPTGGTETLKNAVRAKFERENDLHFGSEQIIVTNGAKQSIFDALMATLEPGDEVILCAPYYDSYRGIVEVLGAARAVASCKAQHGFRIQPDQLAAAISEKTRWIIVNAPSNPAGACYTANDYRALGDVLEQHPRVLIMSDEIYEHICFDKAASASFAAACPELADRILTVNGVSKAYAMTGWRIGYAAGHADLIKAMVTVQSQICSGACSVAQAAAAEALSGPQDCVTEFRTAFARRRDLVVDAIRSIKDLSLVTPGGAFYALINCESLLGRTTTAGDLLTDDAAFVDYLLSAANVAAVPGSVYELPGHFRISTATSDEILSAALARIDEAVAALS